MKTPPRVQLRLTLGGTVTQLHRALIDPCRVLTWRMTRGDWEWYHRGMPKRLRSAVLVS